MNTIDDAQLNNILPLVTHPSRYIGGEVNTVIKQPSAALVSCALCFPDVYEVGISHTGIQILYYLINRVPHFTAQRAYAPWPDMAQALKASHTPLYSLETKTPLCDFDFVGFSLQYELNYTNVLLMLDLAGIPFRAADRLDKDYPLIIGGGPNALYPEPLADFFDIFVIGEAEEVFIELLERYYSYKKQGSIDTEHFLAEIQAHIAGVYVPRLYEPRYINGAYTGLMPKKPVFPATIKKAVIKNLNTSFYPDKQILAWTEPVHERAVVEIMRGCPGTCAFCQARSVYFPYREKNKDTILQQAAALLQNTGFQEISFMGLSSGNHRCIADVIASINAVYQQHKISVSLPSLRADSITREFLESIKKVRKTGITLAPETGSERLRFLLGKQITNQDIIQCAQWMYGLGWSLVKLYFMIGLPGETADDYHAIAQLIKDVRKQGKVARPCGKVNVSINYFVPKPHTALQQCAMINIEKARTIIHGIQNDLNISDISLKYSDGNVSFLESILCRGDRRLSSVIEYAYTSGACFDSWGEWFDMSHWTAAFQKAGIDPVSYQNREELSSAILPWSHIDCGIPASFFADQWHAIHKS